MVTALLVLAFGVALVLGIQAYGAARYHRAQADRVLRDYAALAAARIAQRSANELYFYAILPPLKALQRAAEMTPPSPLPWPSDLRTEAMERESQSALPIRFTFRLDVTTGKLETQGEPASSAARALLLDSLPRHLRTVYDTSWHMGTILGQKDGERHYIAYTVLRDKKNVLRTALGFDANPEGPRPFLVSAYSTRGGISG